MDSLDNVKCIDEVEQLIVLFSQFFSVSQNELSEQGSGQLVIQSKEDLHHNPIVIFN